MNILFVGVFTPRSTNTPQAKALEQIGNIVFKYDYRSWADRLHSDVKRDKHLVEECKALNPDLIIFSKCSQMSSISVYECGKVGKTVLWYMDGINNFDSELISKIEQVHKVCYAHSGLQFYVKEYHSSHCFIPEGFDPEQYYPIENGKKTIDVSFIGSIYGHRYLYVPLFKHFNDMYGEDHSRIVSCSKINLNFTTDLGSSDRVYKVLASKGFLITERWHDMDKMFTDGVDLITFVKYEELKSLIKYFLSHEKERNQIAENGYKTVQKYTIQNWARKIIENI